MTTAETLQHGPNWELWHDAAESPDDPPHINGPLHLTIRGKPFSVQSEGRIVDVTLPPDLAALAAGTDRVFEVVDSTDEERYWPLGMFPTLDAAKAALDQCDPTSLPGDHDPYEDDLCRIEIRERRTGWSGQGRVVCVVEWRKVYHEAEDEYVWTREEAKT